MGNKCYMFTTVWNLVREHAHEGGVCVVRACVCVCIYEEKEGDVHVCKGVCVCACGCMCVGVCV